MIGSVCCEKSRRPNTFSLSGLQGPRSTRATRFEIFSLRGGPRQKKSGQLFASVSLVMTPWLQMSPLMQFRRAPVNCRCRRAMPQNCGKLGGWGGDGEGIPGNVQLLPSSPPHGSQNETIPEYSGLNRGSRWSCATAIITRLAGFASK